MPSPLGEILITAGEEGLMRVMFADACGTSVREKHLQGTDDVCPQAEEVLCQTERWLELYFSGQRPGELPRLAPADTAFRQTVREALLTVSCGETVSYGMLAEKCAGLPGKDRASARAVGGALARNPVWILVPCHRVCASDGSLHGYAGGLERKAWLLDHEKKMRETWEREER